MRFLLCSIFSLALFCIILARGQTAQILSAIAGIPAYIAPGTLAYHLSTNAAAHARNREGSYDDIHEVTNWFYGNYSSKTPFPAYVKWSTNFWLHGARGLSATSLGTTNGMGGQGLLTMISPRHYLIAGHINGAQCGNMPVAFLATNDVLVWRTPLDYALLTNDVAVGIMNSDLPPSVGFVPLLPPDYAEFLPTNNISYFQGLDMNQDLNVFSQPMAFAKSYRPLDSIHWSFFAIPRIEVPFGVGTNWTVLIRGGDSSAPARILIGDQLVLVSHNFGVGLGPNYAYFIECINQTMHRLSVKNHLKTDYQLTTYSLTNFTKLNQ